MSVTVPPTDAVSSPRQRLARALRAALEAVVLLLVCFAPWPFGSVHPLFEFILFAGVAVVLVLWSLSILVEWRFTWKRCPVTLCLAGLIVLGVLQLTPLSRGLRSWLSPAGEKLLARLKPAAPEAIVPGQPQETPQLAAGSMLSLYPGGTRLAVLRLLGVFLLFAAVRNTYASKESLRRLGFVCLANGAALALFALVQFFTTQRHVVFWVYETGGTVFGPFINRNHFAFFVNVCVCLTGGLLAAYWLGRTRNGGVSWNAFLQHAPTLWLGFFGLLMLASLAFCLSRGGLLALFLGCVAAVAVHWAYAGRRSWRGPAVVAALLLGFGLLAWYVLPSAEARLATLRHDSTEDYRLSAWAGALRIGRDYPLAGSGYGTFGLLEPSYRSSGIDPRVVFTFAHNDYLEALAEGGVPRLLVSVAAVAAVFWLGLRAYRRYRNHPAGGWVLGALAAFTAVAVHSFFDFGLHIPAVALLTAVLAAHLAALGARRTSDNRQEEYSVRLFGLGPLLAAAALLLLAVALPSEGWRLSQAERFRLAAQSRDIHRATESHAPQVAYLTTAVYYAPDDAALRLALAEAHLWQAEYTSEPGHRAAAAQQLLMARALCPVMRQPYVKLAALTSEFSSSDAPAAYLERATLLEPTDPYLWYLRGGSEQTAGNDEAAWHSWRRSLELSERYLPDILKRLGDQPDGRAVAERLLPDDPALLVRTARLLYPQDEAAREPLLRRAAELLSRQAGNQGKDFHLRGQIQDGLGDRTAALESYRQALARDGRQTEWRYELADLLYRDGQPREAEQELKRVLSEQRHHEKARALLETVQRDTP